MKLAFDCVFYYVSDVERAIRFYSDVLGFKLSSQDFVARFEVDGVLFEIVPTSEHDKVAGGGNARLCLKVDDIQTTLLELQQKGVVTSQPKKETGGVLASFQDPDGNEVCLWQYSGPHTK
jgi:predicted enzyme related to lactoylglutathione lyase